MRPEISTIQLPAGNMGSYYRSKLSANGNGNIQFSADEKKLPPGLRLYPDGTIKGMPLKNGSYAGGIKATDEDGESIVQSFIILINCKPDAAKENNSEKPPRCAQKLDA